MGFLILRFWYKQAGSMVSPGAVYPPETMNIRPFTFLLLISIILCLQIHILNDLVKSFLYISHFGMLLSINLLIMVQRLLIECQSLSITALKMVQACQVAQGLGLIGMLRPQLLANRKRTLIELLGL